MGRTSADDRRRLESMDRAALRAHQLGKLNDLLARILPANHFYQEKLDGFEFPLESLEQLAALPFTYKEDLQQPGGHAANATFPTSEYTRYHQTSGTRGRPLAVLDTAADWRWWIDCWQHVLDAAGVTPRDCVLFAFSFGPFIGFWSANDAAVDRGCLVVPSGGMSTLARLELIRTSKATVLLCTPSYALRMAEVAGQRQIDVAGLGVRVIIVAGEPGGSIPATRQRIEDAWHARVLDHAGSTEVGPWGYGDRERRGLHVLEGEFIAEFLSVESGRPARDGELAELVLTNLGRVGSPVLRYRTGDVVRPVHNHGQVNRFVLLEGGVLGRADDMLVIRGVNVYPHAVEQILRGFPEVVEFRVTARRSGEMDQLSIEVEDHLAQPARIAEELRMRLGLKIDVRLAAAGSLPRFEGKGRRFVDQR